MSDTMERITLRAPKEQIELVESRVESGEFPNRSEAIRAAIREKFVDPHEGKGSWSREGERRERIRGE